MREPWLSFTKDSITLNFLKFLFFCNNYYGKYLVHPHKILPAWLRFKLNAMEQVLPAYTVENEIHICLGIWDTEIKKNYLYKNENHFASVGQRANLCLGWHPILFSISFDKSISYIFNCKDLLCIYFFIPQFQYMKVIQSTLSKMDNFGTSPDGPS